MIISLLRVLLIAWECRLVIQYTHIQAKCFLRLFLVSCFCLYVAPGENQSWFLLQCQSCLCWSNYCFLPYPPVNLGRTGFWFFSKFATGIGRVFELGWDSLLWWWPLFLSKVLLSFKQVLQLASRRSFSPGGPSVFRCLKYSYICVFISSSFHFFP